MKDYFSEKSEDYARFRPSWPDALFTHLFGLCTGKGHAWDCATGNGQMAVHLAEHFDRVQATDISIQQLAEAVPHPHIQYSKARAEKCPFPNQSFDLITVGQAAHWFDHARFYKEVKRVLKPEGYLALAGYGLARIKPDVDSLVDELYADVLGAYWPPERKHIDQRYQSLPFPFLEVSIPDQIQQLSWNVDHLLGYLRTWSAVKEYVRVHGTDPVDLFDSRLRRSWGVDKRTIQIPVFCRTGQPI